MYKPNRYILPNILLTLVVAAGCSDRRVGFKLPLDMLKGVSPILVNPSATIIPSEVVELYNLHMPYSEARAELASDPIIKADYKCHLHDKGSACSSPVGYGHSVLIVLGPSKADENIKEIPGTASSWSNLTIVRLAVTPK